MFHYYTTNIVQFDSVSTQFHNSHVFSIIIFLCCRTTVITKNGVKNDSKGTGLLLRLDTTQDLEVDYKITTTSLSGSGGGYGPR